MNFVARELPSIIETEYNVMFEEYAIHMGHTSLQQMIELEGVNFSCLPFSFQMLPNLG